MRARSRAVRAGDPRGADVLIALDSDLSTADPPASIRSVTLRLSDRRGGRPQRPGRPPQTCVAQARAARSSFRRLAPCSGGNSASTPTSTPPPYFSAGLVRASAIAAARSSAVTTEYPPRSVDADLTDGGPLEDRKPRLDDGPSVAVEPATPRGEDFLGRCGRLTPQGTVDKDVLGHLRPPVAVAATTPALVQLDTGRLPKRAVSTRGCHLRCRPRLCSTTPVSRLTPVLRL